MEGTTLPKEDRYFCSFSWVRGEVYLREMFKSKCHSARLSEVCLLGKDNVRNGPFELA